MEKFEFYDRFVDRHIGPSEEEINDMLAELNLTSIDELIEKTVPKGIRIKETLDLPEALTEFEFLHHLKNIAQKNKVFKSYIGMGYYPTITPGVIQRNILENPGWYTQYTPYQAEISQGRLEALINFQTMVTDLTGMELANASLLDEATAAAEAMSMFYSVRKNNKKNADVFLADINTFPQTLDVLKTRSEPINIKLRIEDISENKLSDDVFAILLQYPNNNGEIHDLSNIIRAAHERGIYVVVAADLLGLALLTPPGEMGADAVVGSAQRFGVPMGYGGPHAAYFATRDEFKRQIPGRIIGVSIDSHNRLAFRMALQTREQHIKREKATSNICTAQVLLAVMAGMYAVYHGPKGIRKIAERIHNYTLLLNEAIKKLGLKQTNEYFFDTLKINAGTEEVKARIKKLAVQKEINFRYFEDNFFGISLHEKVQMPDIQEIVDVLAEALEKESFNVIELSKVTITNWDENIIRKSEYMTHPKFNSFYSEHEMLRYIKNLERKDLSLTTSMIPLGSCTMKLNASTEMFGISWAEFATLHPFAPREQAAGYSQLFEELENYLNKITGFTATSLQPNSGAQGEYAGLMVIRAYHKDRGDHNRNVVLIPSSAHGTNPASAVMAGGQVVVIKCDDEGNIDITDLREKAEKYKDNLSALMVTYPSTHGVFEEGIKEICDIVHKNGGLVYMDGANMNAQVGLTTPAEIGADVCHLNLHKTFTIPHGGGGPGMGPIAVNDKLAKYLPGHPVININNEKSIPAVSAAPWGSASILVISYAYIKMMGTEGLTRATEIAILNANYLKAKLSPYYKVLYSGRNNFVGHELIFDLREFKHSVNIEAEDVAKRLMDYSYHAPTVSFPVPGTFMVEPTESESKAELDRFVDAMISIRNEIREIEEGKSDKEDNVLKNSPHVAEDLISENWNHSYSREKAGFPLSWIKENKFWTSVGRVNNAYGDRNLVCTCPSIEEY
ncbi:MAG TPA: glycine dehydrogenase (aminomethyl-transferring) [Ignavibacteria bacterium]|nr:glycine dehydrogenase (aminomethyl-transferring) [Ignavibacteria bacterium]